MDNRIFIMVYMVVSVTVCVSSVIIALFRKRTHLVIFALSFIYFSLGAYLFSIQNNNNLIISVVFGNLVSLLGVLMLFTSIRAYFDYGILWPRRFFAYIAVLLLSVISTTLVSYNLPLRSLLVGAIYASVFLDFLLFLRQQIMAALIRVLLVSAVLVSALLYVSRVIMVFALSPNGGLSSASPPQNAYVFISHTITSFLWFAAIILIDDNKLLERLNANEERYRLLAESASDIIWVYDFKRDRLTYVSPSVENLCGYKPEELIGLSIAETMTEESYEKCMSFIGESAREFFKNPDQAGPFYIEVQHRCKDGKLKWVEMSLKLRFGGSGEPEIVGVSRDINERKRKEDVIKYLNMHDPFTGLLNRNALRTMCMDEAASSHPAEKRSVIFVDIDNFRVINDSLGHAAGDSLISEIASKLKACVSDHGLIFRYYGDEFIIVVNSADVDLIRRISRDIQSAVSTRVMLGDRVFYLTASIGYCAAQDGENIEKTIINADTALYVAKRTKNTICAFNSSMDKTKTREALLEEDISGALSKNELLLYYQPIIGANDGKLSRSEALLRWEHPELGRVSPYDFIQIAERTRLIIPITEWVITEVCSQIVKWEHAGLEMTVGINLSPVCIVNREAEFRNFLMGTLNKFGVAPDRIKLEITEDTFMKNLEETISVCSDLKAAGVGLALDDFGTGYSSFGYIKDIPLKYIKLDKSFIGLIDSNIKEQTIVRGMIGIAHGLGLTVIAEGVETEMQLKMLCEYGCDFIQGYYFSRPLSAQDFEKYCRSGEAVEKLRRVFEKYSFSY